MQVIPERLLRLRQVHDVTPVGRRNCSAGVGAKKGVSRCGNDHVGPSRGKIFGGAVQERGFLLQAKLRFQSDGLDPEADHAKERLANDSVRQYTTKFAGAVQSAEPSVLSPRCLEKGL